MEEWVSRKGRTESKTSHSVYDVEWKEEKVRSRDGAKETIPVSGLEQAQLLIAFNGCE